MHYQGLRRRLARESSQMQDVYANAVVNLAANDAIHSTRGLGGMELNKKFLDGVEVGLLPTGDPVYARPLRQNTDSSGVSHVPNGLSITHVLNTRAWVLQERMLSPRILHFSAFEIAWKCDSQVKCECSLEPREQKIRAFRTQIIRPPSSGSDVTKSWCGLVETYSTLDLTFQSDKMRALAGLASRAAKCWSKSYVAGIMGRRSAWLSRLVHGLVFRAIFRTT
jgi:hypothetical protein